MCGLGSVLTHLPLFCLSLGLPHHVPYPVHWLPVCAYWPTLLPLLPCSLTYPGCPWPILWLPAGLSLATLGLSWAPLGLVPVLVPYLFSWLLLGCSLAIPWLLLGLALGWPVLHPLYLGLRPVTCPVPWSGASGYQYSYPLVSISIGSVWYLLDSITFYVPWFRVYYLASLIIISVLGYHLGLLCPCVKGLSSTLGRFPRACYPTGVGPKPCFIVLCFI